MRIIVTNAHSRIAYRCIKALARLGHEVISSDFIPLAMSFYSRYSCGHFLYPSPYENPLKFLNHMTSFAMKNGVKFILPIHEESFIFAKCRELIPTEIHLAVPNYKAILSVHNKGVFHDIARKLGIPVPKTFTIYNIDDLYRIVAQIDYGVVLKPRQGGGNYAIRFVHNTGCLKDSYLNHMRENNLIFERLQIQEYLPPKEKYSQVFLFNHGNPVAKFTDLHLRDYPPEGGAGCFRVTTEYPEIEAYTEKILRHLKWHGVAEAEYIVSKTDGKPYLIEINPRIWGGVNSAISSGLNIPGLLLKIAFGKKITPEETEYQKGWNTRWFYGDLKGLKRQLIQSPNKLHRLIESLNIFQQDCSIDEFSKSDPLPFFVYPLSMLRLYISKRNRLSNSDYSLLGEWS